MIEPVGRASAWRYGFNTEKNYDDTQLYCGGLTRQWAVNKGKCGICGDAYDMKTPRPHEFGGKYGTGEIVKIYKKADIIDVKILITAYHRGFFEFFLCDSVNATETCFDNNKLQIIYNKLLLNKYYPSNGANLYKIQIKLNNITCKNCVLLWKYTAGNNWGVCEDGVGRLGCGPQEEFRSCADIKIIDNVSPDELTIDDSFDNPIEDYDNYFEKYDINYDNSIDNYNKPVENSIYKLILIYMCYTVLLICLILIVKQKIGFIHKYID